MASSSSSSPEIPPAVCVDTTESQSRFSYKDATQEEVLEDLSSRFILNLPDEELNEPERVCFQVEQAHWFYEDFIREENTKLPSLPLKKFSEMLFSACPILQQYDDHEEIFNKFLKYKTRVPVCGAIMLNDAMDKCVLVKGWKSSSGWGFPKGKINETEPPHTCAIREVLEETGYNLVGQLNPDDVISLSIREQKISLYIVPGVPEDFNFQTKTRKEISKIEWFKLTDLPTWKRNKASPGRFYLITPFIVRLKMFINERKPRNGARKNAKQRKNQQPAPSQTPKNEPATSNGILHGSISQSSSFGNGNPRIPSPQQLESAVNPAQNSVAVNAPMDPHFARLLSSLTLSAMASSAKTDNGKTSEISPSDVNTTAKSVDSLPIHNSDVSGDSPVAPRAREQCDRPSLVPPQQPQSLDRLTSHLSPMSPSVNSTNAPPLHNTRPSLNGAGIGTYANQTLSQSIHNDAKSPLPPTTSPTSPPRRAPSTADISPYLSRQTEVPTSAKRLKQLSLLESVADESARLAPIIAARAAMASRGPTPAAYPLPPSSVPPQLPPPYAREMGVLYSSTHTGPSSSAAGFHPRNPLENSAFSHHDPFQVRSRTSQAFYRAPMHNPAGSVSMNQNHLLAVMNGSRAGPVSPNYPMGAQFIHQQPQMFNVGPPYHGGPGLVQYPPPPTAPVMHGYGPLSNPPPDATRIPPYPVTNSSVPPGMSMVPNGSHKPSLLSILNGRPSQ